MAAYQSDGAVEMWALEMSQRIYVNEVKMVIHKVHGLHFNACSTTAEDITNFSLEKIIHKFCDVTPKTWTLMQTLLDVNGEACQHAKLLKVGVDYYKQHDPEADPGELAEDSMSESETESEGESMKEGHTQVRWCNMALLQIVS